METVLDIILLAFIVLGTYIGARKGLIKSLVNLVGLLAIVIISYTLRVPLANFLIDKLPFFNFGGALEGITAINILIYNLLAFIVIFVLLYCVLNIILDITGFIDTLLKLTIIWVIPSKIGGAIIGFIESWVFLYLALFILVQFSFTNALISSSKVANIILDNTPVIGNYLGGAKLASEKIYDIINEEEKTEEDMNIDILGILVQYNIISDAKVTELMEIGKINLDNVSISRPTVSK